MMSPADHLIAELIVEGERACLTARNPLAPQHGATLVVETADGRHEQQADRTTTYFHQLVAFRDAVTSGAPFPTTADDGADVMDLIDRCYTAAGLRRRPALA